MVRFIPILVNQFVICRSVSKKVQKMTKLNFCPNLTFMFTEHKMFDRYQIAAQCGFTAVEMCFPYDFEVEELKRSAIIDTILINSYPGDSFGFAALPGREKDFQDSMDKSLKYVDALGAKRLHIMSGIHSDLSATRNECYEILEKNLRSLLPSLERRNVVGVIEPINKKTIPGYFLNNYKEALDLVKKINSPFLRLQLDIFHLQQIQGDLTNFIHEAMPFVGHIQIAQVPDRHEPDSQGEIHYPYIFDLLIQNKYKGWIGLEYKPKKGTVEGLEWVRNYL